MSHLVRRIINLCLALVLTVMSVNLSGVMSLNTAHAASNNGTLQVHEKGTPPMTPSNQPHVCVFNFEAFNLDANQTGNVTIEAQSPTPNITPVIIPLTTDATGNGATTPYVNDTGSPYVLADGHYKATLDNKFGTDNGNKAKSKVFWVHCDAAPVTPEAPTVSVQPSSCIANGSTNGSAVITVTNTADATGAAVTYTVGVTGKSPQTLTNLADGQSADVTFTGLAAGNYTVTVTGNDGQAAITTVFTITTCPPTVVPVTPPTYIDDCSTAKDTYTIPSTPGAIYQVQNILGVYQTKSAGTYNVTAAQYLTGVKIRAVPVSSAYVLDGTTKWEFNFSAKPCTVPATPPTKSDYCGTANDTYTIPSSAHVKYYVNLSPIATPAGTYATTKDVLIIAVPDPGYLLSTQFVWVFAYSNKACPTPVTPQAPIKTDDCGTSKDGYTIPTTTGVVYKVNGAITTAGFYPATGTVAITAEAAPDYTLNGQSAWDFSFDNTACEPEPCTPSVVSALTLSQLVPNSNNCVPGMGGGGTTPQTPSTTNSPVLELPQTGPSEGNTFAKIFTILAAGLTTYATLFFVVNRRELLKK